MFLKDILVHIDDDAGAPARIDTAAALAAAHDARLTGLYVRPPIEIPYLAQSFTGPALRETLAKAADDVSARLRALFEQRTAAPAKAIWRETTGPAAEEVAALARYADLAVVGPANVDQPSVRRLSGQVVLTAGVPVLMVPEHPAVRTLGQRVLVAWNASPESARAIRGALPLLTAASAVEVLVVVAGEPAAAGPPPGRQLVDYLAQHGVDAAVKVMKLDDVYGVGGSIIARAEATGADLIVMGAFGRSRLREAMVGSTTGTLLTRSPVPLLVSH